MAKKAPSTKRVLDKANKAFAETDKLNRTFATELQRVQSDLDRELRRLVRGVQDGKASDLVKASRGLRLRTELRTALQKSGFDDLADASTLRGLDRLTKAVEARRLSANLGAFSPSDTSKIQALKELARTDLLAQGDETAIALWRSTVQGLYSERPVDDIIDDLADALDISMAEARTLYNTNMAIYQRQLEAIAKRPGDLFIYYGPDDKKVRRFCRQHLGKVYEWEEFSKMDNGGKGDPTLVGGGFNCRHALIAISRLSKAAKYHKTGKRVPGLEAMMNGIAPAKVA